MVFFMILAEFIDSCSSDVEILLCKGFSDDCSMAKFSTSFKCNSFYAFNSLKFYDASHLEESAIFVDVALLKNCIVRSFFPVDCGRSLCVCLEGGNN